MMKEPAFLLVFLPEHSIISPASRARCYVPAKRLDAYLDVRIIPVTAHYTEWAKTNLQLLRNCLLLFSIARESDKPVKVVAQRGADLLGRAWLLAIWRKVTRQKLIFDFDDAIFLNAPRRTKLLCATSDAVITSTKYLADYASRYAKRVSVVPTLIDLETYTTGVRKRHDVPVIGWIGTPSNLPYLEAIEQPLRRLRESNEFSIRVVTDPKFRADIPLSGDLNVEVVPWSLLTYVSELAKLDVGICPLPDDEWTRGKAGYKTLEYMAMGIPPVASAVGNNREIIDDGKDGFLVTNGEQWYDRLRLLLDNEGFRIEMGNRAVEAVRTKFSLQSFLPRLREYYGAV